MYVCIHTPAPAPAPAETAERCEEARGVTARGRGGEHFRAAAAAAADERGVGAGGVTARGGGGGRKKGRGGRREGGGGGKKRGIPLRLGALRALPPRVTVPWR